MHCVFPAKRNIQFYLSGELFHGRENKQVSHSTTSEQTENHARGRLVQNAIQIK